MNKIDLHIHSISSFDSNIRIDLAIKIAKKLGLKGISITDHNRLTKIKLEEKNLIFIEGSEISTTSGEILAYGIQELIKPHQSLDDAIDKIHEQAAVVVAAHPFDLFRQGIGKKISKKLDGIEVLNSRCLDFFNKKTGLESKKFGLSFIAGSDAHTFQEIGSAFTDFSDVRNQDDVLRAIKKGRCRPEGKTSSAFVHTKSYIIRLEKIFRLI